MMSVTVGTRGSRRRNEKIYEKKAEKQWKGNILENAGAVCHEVFCLQFCYVQVHSRTGTYRQGCWDICRQVAVKQWMKILPAYCNKGGPVHAQLQQGGGS